MQKVLSAVFAMLFATGCAVSGGRSKADSGHQDSQVVVCGDGLLSELEACDDGNLLEEDGCSPTCELEPGWQCTGEPSVCTHVCGNGAIDDGEECDGALLNGADCTTVAGGYTGGTLVCTAECQLDITGCVLSTCGNGTIDPPSEECDDGNPSNEDSCLNNCRLNVCGDGFVNPAQEECDDSGLVSGDGCSDTCQTESLPVLYSLSSISGGWSTQTIYYAGELNAPSTPVVAAFSASRRSEAWVLTNTSYHVLTVPGLQWVESGTLSSRFTGLPGWQLAGGWGIDQETEARTWVGFQANSLAYVYYLDDAGQITTTMDNPITVDWQPPPYAPDPVDVQASWYDANNTHNWSSCNPSTICTTTAVELEAYGTVLTQAGTLHLYEALYCGEFYDFMALSSFPPFVAPGAPAAVDVLAAFFDNPSETLYIIAAQ